MGWLYQTLPPQIRRWRILIALGITIVTLLWITVTLERRGKPTQPSFVPVVIARTSIPAHRVLHPALIAPWNSRPPVPEGAFTHPQDLQGFLTIRDLQPGEVITRDAVAPPEKVFGAASMVPQGMRAITIVVQGSQGFDGRLTPGALVDVIAVIAKSQVPEARTVLTGARVLHVKPSGSQGQGALPGAPGSGGVEVTLAVPPELTPPLALAQAHGQLMLALHSARDPSSPAAPGRPRGVARVSRPHPKRSARAGTFATALKNQGKQPTAPLATNVRPRPQVSQTAPVQPPRSQEIELILGEQRMAISLNLSQSQGGKER